MWWHYKLPSDSFCRTRSRNPDRFLRRDYITKKKKNAQRTCFDTVPCYASVMTRLKYPVVFVSEKETRQVLHYYFVVEAINTS